MNMRMVWLVALALLSTVSWPLATLGNSDPLLGSTEIQTAPDAMTEVAGGVTAVLLLGRRS